MDRSDLSVRVSGALLAQDHISTEQWMFTMVHGICVMLPYLGTWNLPQQINPSQTCMCSAVHLSMSTGHLQLSHARIDQRHCHLLVSDHAGILLCLASLCAWKAADNRGELDGLTCMDDAQDIRPNVL